MSQITSLNDMNLFKDSLFSIRNRKSGQVSLYILQMSSEDSASYLVMGRENGGYGDSWMIE